MKKKAKLPSVEIVSSLIFKKKGVADRVYLKTNIKSPIKHEDLLHLEFNCPEGYGYKYVFDVLGIESATMDV